VPLTSVPGAYPTRERAHDHEYVYRAKQTSLSPATARRPQQTAVRQRRRLAAYCYWASAGVPVGEIQSCAKDEDRF
jgi:hypothetical protein